MLRSQILALVFHLASVVLATTNGTEQTIQPRIVGGFVASIRDLKYLVHIFANDELCGGSLITTRWVISAAHCVYNKRVEVLRVYGGSSVQGSRNAIQRLVNLVAIPSQFNMRTMNMDVAALYLNREMIGPNVGTIRLASQPAPPGSLVKVSGWGLLRPSSSETARVVHSVIMPVWSNADCRAAYRGERRITRFMVCASKPFRRDSCDGDSGGPMTYRGQLVGIVSFGNECASREPGVYTSVPAIRRWFMDIISLYS